jgi:signal peptidase I
MSTAEQAGSPYAPPKTHSDPGEAWIRRYPWIAVALAVLSPVYAMLYVARGWRAVGYFAASLGALALAILLTAFLGVPSNAAAGLGALGLRIVGGIDGYRRASEWSASARLPWYARWPGLTSIVVIGILGVTSLRAFVAEPFHIPTGAMYPTLIVGDYILVNKSAYGLRLPPPGGLILALGQPDRGDVVVFRCPERPDLDYIKRIVGLPGDTVAYYDKRLSVNGQEVQRAADSGTDRPGGSGAAGVIRYRETLGRHTYTIQIDPDQPAYQAASVRQFPSRDKCEYGENGFRCVVPAGHYFALGDNRDSSSDSRYWGFVPEVNLVGRAFLVWCSTGRPERMGLKLD